MKIYLDACCLCRPFDDQGIDRNRIEAETVLTILRRIYQTDWLLIRSEVLEAEIDMIELVEKRELVKGYLALAGESVAVESGQLKRMHELTKTGIKPFDALHLACAEDAGCDVFLTTDDRLLKLARSNADRLHVRVDNPKIWFSEQIDADSGIDIE